MNEEPHVFSLYGEGKNPIIPKQVPLPVPGSFKDLGREGEK